MLRSASHVAERTLRCRPRTQPARYSPCVWLSSPGVRSGGWPQVFGRVLLPRSPTATPCPAIGMQVQLVNQNWTHCNLLVGFENSMQNHTSTTPTKSSGLPRGLCKHQCKSHLHSARVDPPCLRGVHLPSEVRSVLPVVPPSKARTEACLLPPLRLTPL